LSTTEIQCTYQDLIVPLNYIPDIKHCQEKCLAHWGCKFFVYNEDRDVCKLYGSAEKTCKKVRGPRNVALNGCPKSDLKILSVPSDFVGGQCPKPTIKTYQDDDGQDHCCFVTGCCLHKCENEEPPFDGLENIPNSQWIFSEDFGYWQLWQYNSETTTMLSREILLSRAAQTISADPPGLNNLLWNSIYKQMEG